GRLGVMSQELGELVPRGHPDRLHDHQGVLDGPGTGGEVFLQRPLDAKAGHGCDLPSIASQSMGPTMPSLRAVRWRAASVSASVPIASAIPASSPAHTSTRFRVSAWSPMPRTMASCSGPSCQLAEASTHTTSLTARTSCGAHGTDLDSSPEITRPITRNGAKGSTMPGVFDSSSYRCPRA